MTGPGGPSAVADVVVAGAGQNSAAEELLLPGFKLDSCSRGHTLIQTNPLLVDDELGLIAEHGLTYSPTPSPTSSSRTEIR